MRTARELAQRYEVSVRTIERDIAALQQVSIPIYADVGRRGGYALAKSMSLPPLNFTAAEAVALAVALARSEATPFDQGGAQRVAQDSRGYVGARCGRRTQPPRAGLVQDVPATVAAAEKLGKVSVPPVTGKDGLVFAHILDTSGNDFGIFSPPPQS